MVEERWRSSQYRGVKATRGHETTLLEPCSNLSGSQYSVSDSRPAVIDNEYSQDYSIRPMMFSALVEERAAGLS